MPELPEVETVARQLSPLLAGRRIERLEVKDRRRLRLDAGAAASRRIGQVRRGGKQVLLELRGPRGAGPLWLAVHLRMTGRLLWRAEGPPPEPVPHLRARLVLDRGAVDFVDPRRFGVLRLVGAPEEALAGGMDPCSEAFQPGALARMLAGSRQALKAWLLRQDRLEGLGNIYASEILWAARLHPTRAAGSLSPAEVRRLCSATRRILGAAIRACGTTFSDFQDARGVEGGFGRFLAVYGREGEPCRRCGAAVARLAQQQRSTFWCPGCQRDPQSHDLAGRKPRPGRRVVRPPQAR